MARFNEYLYAGLSFFFFSLPSSSFKISPLLTVKEDRILKFTQSTHFIADTVGYLMLLSLFTSENNSGSLFQSNSRNSFLSGMQLPSVLSGCPQGETWRECDMKQDTNSTIIGYNGTRPYDHPVKMTTPLLQYDHFFVAEQRSIHSLIWKPR